MMKAFLNNAITHWKTTLQSILTVTFAITGYLMTASIISPHTAAMLTIVNGIAKVILGCMQQDSNTTHTNNQNHLKPK